MLHPTIEELTQGKFNRYELALATARCARIVTDEYVQQHELAEKSQTGNKESDKPLNTMIDKELRDEKAVHVAVNRLRDGIYVIDPEAGAYVPPAPVEAAAEAPVLLSLEEDEESAVDGEEAADKE